MRPLGFRNFTLVLFALITAGCSLVTLGYNNGEALAYWWLNGHIDVEDEQRGWVRERIDRLFVWHRKTQLKDYVQWMAHKQTQLNQPVTATDVVTAYDDLKKRAWIMVEQALPDLADLALSLTPQQIAHLEKKLSENNDEYRKDHLHRDIDYRQKYRFKKIIKQAEYWLGDLSREQEAEIRRASDARPMKNEVWMEERLQRQKALLALLRKIQTEKPDRQIAMQWIRNYAYAVFERSMHPDNRAFYEASRDSTAQLIADMLNRASPEQKAHAIKMMQQWIDNFQRLAAKR